MTGLLIILLMVFAAIEHRHAFKHLWCKLHRTQGKRIAQTKQPERSGKGE